MIPPVTASPLATYRAYLARHELAYQFSPQAGKAVFFPRLVCPYTGTTELEWRVSQGRGEVHATTVVFPRDAEPYNVALIAAGFSLSAFAAADTFVSDANHTFSSFSYSHFGFSNQQSRFNNTTAKVTLDRAAKTGSVEATIDAKSVA